jgi:hypothetical protein
MEGEATANPPAQSPYTPCPERGPGPKSTGRHSFVEKEKAGRQDFTGLHLGLLISQEPNCKDNWRNTKPHSPPKRQVQVQAQAKIWGEKAISKKKKRRVRKHPTQIQVQTGLVGQMGMRNHEVRQLTHQKKGSQNLKR